MAETAISLGAAGGRSLGIWAMVGRSQKEFIDAEDHEHLVDALLVDAAETTIIVTKIASRGEVYE